MCGMPGGHYTVVLADTRGYGDPGKPAPDATGVIYSKRAMACDQARRPRQRAAMPVGHFLPEEAPELVTAALRDFLD